MSWVKITVNADPSILEELSPLFFEMGCQGINELEDSFQLFFEKNEWNDNKRSFLVGILKRHKPVRLTDLIEDDIQAENWNEN